MQSVVDDTPFPLTCFIPASRQGKGQTTDWTETLLPTLIEILRRLGSFS